MTSDNHSMRGSIVGLYFKMRCWRNGFDTNHCQCKNGLRAWKTRSACDAAHLTPINPYESSGRNILRIVDSQADELLIDVSATLDAGNCFLAHVAALRKADRAIETGFQGN